MKPAEYTPRQTAEIMAKVTAPPLCSRGCVEQCGQPFSCQAEGEAPGAYRGDSGPLQPPAPGEVDWTPPELLKLATQAATRALDRAYELGLTIPPQAAAGVAMLDTTAQLLAAQSPDDTPTPTVITP